MSRAPVEVAGARVGVLGLRKSGTAVTRLLADRGAEVYASDISSIDAVTAAAAAIAGPRVQVETGRHDPARLATCDWIVTSPGIPPRADVLRDPGVAARPIYSEIEVASWFAAAPIAAVTGTNGKTTTTALLGEVARAGGIVASVAGNIGRAFSQAVLEDPAPEWYVIEVSSFQLARIAAFRPNVAVVLNLTPDHLDVYGSMADYTADKQRITENMGHGDHLCLNAEDRSLEAFGAARPLERHHFHRWRPVERGAHVEGGWIALAGERDAGRVLPTESLGIPGAHNIQNALAATLAGSLMGVSRAAIADALAEFRGVPHRLETVAEVGGVLFVNDSKATNVDSALVALEAFDAPLVVILGGRHKEAPYAPLAPALARRGKRVLAIGEAADRIAEELGGTVAVEKLATLDRAVRRAFEIARPGDVVLLSPACSSYDQFPGYDERGKRFRELVAELGPRVEVAR
ncbi:MAG TPA: UDP-N-acetylmuramoyl-L-alanine--D-glutamate ligase [Gemmatimonadota bacterium]|nr:UDP-N-acetylmuramoyl-L-alanine--D-glutamate ligase [Gemmatimonadota bacterium]